MTLKNKGDRKPDQRHKIATTGGRAKRGGGRGRSSGGNGHGGL